MRTFIDKEPTILFEDNHLLVVVKPAGLLSQSDRTGHPDLQTVLKRFIAKRDKKPGEAFVAIVHRLDRMVGGVMVFAKTSKAAGRLSDQLRHHVIDKFYLAVVHGHLPEPILLWQDYLSTKTVSGRYFVTDSKQGKKALLLAGGLAYDQDEDCSLIAIKLLTGRSHQIRVQSSQRGYPLIGDRRYGTMSLLDEKTPSVNLFAAALALDHPITGERLHFFFAPPKGLLFDRFVETIDTLDGVGLVRRFADADTGLV